MKIKNLFFAAAVALGAVVACQNKQNVPEGVSVDPTDVAFDKAGETKEVAITASAAWTMTIPEEVAAWVEVSDKSGAGSAKVSLKAAKNEGNDRNGTITVKSGYYSAKIKLSQPGEKGEKVDSPIEKLLATEVPYSGGKTQPIVGGVNLTDVWWVAKYPNNGVITDGTAFITVFNSKATFAGEVGEKGTLPGDLDNYSYRNQVTNPVFTKTGTVEVNHGTAIELKDQIDTYDWQNSPIVYVHVDGTVRKNGDYYNIYFDGCTKDGSFASNTLSDKGAQYADKQIDFYGYFVSGTTHVSIVPVGNITVKGEVAPELKVTAKQTTTGFEASWNTVNGATSYEWAIYEGPVEEEVVIGEGTTTETKIAVSEDDLDADLGPEYTYYVVVTALKEEEVIIEATGSFEGRDMSIPDDATVVEVNFLEKIEADGFPVDVNDVKDGTYTLNGYEFVFHATNYFKQFSSSSVIQALLIGKKDAFIELPIVSGKKLSVVEFKTGPSASEKVIVDIATADNTLLKINESALKKGSVYNWSVDGAVDTKYRIYVVNDNNAQFQYLKLIYQ